MKKHVKHLMLVTLFAACSTALPSQSGSQLEAKPIVFSRVRSIYIPVEPTDNNTSAISRYDKSPLLEMRDMVNRQNKFQAATNKDFQFIWSKCDDLTVWQKALAWSNKYGNYFEKRLLNKESEIARRLGAVFVMPIPDTGISLGRECLDTRYDITDQVIAELNADYSANQFAIEQEYDRLLEEAVCKLAEIKRDCK